MRKVEANALDIGVGNFNMGKMRHWCFKLCHFQSHHSNSVIYAS